MESQLSPELVEAMLYSGLVFVVILGLCFVGAVMESPITLEENEADDVS